MSAGKKTAARKTAAPKIPPMDKKPTTRKPAAKKAAPPKVPEKAPRKPSAPPVAAGVPPELAALVQVQQKSREEAGTPPPPASTEAPRAIDLLPLKQATFVREFLVDLNGTQAAIRAGYSHKGADVQAVRLLGNARVQAAIKEEQAARVERLEIDADEITRRWHTQLNANPNELTQFRRPCCRHCWGVDFGYQYTPAEFDRARLKHEKQRADILAKSKSDIGEFAGLQGDWFDKRRAPNPECPECFGEGVGETFLADTRHLSPAALALYAGVKEGKDGIEVKMHSQERAGENLARALGLFKDKEVEVNLNITNADELNRIYFEKMRAAHERQARVNAERGAEAD